MTTLPIEVLLGIAYGLLIGTVLAFVFGVLGFCYRYYAKRTIPQLVVIGGAVLAGAGIGQYMGVLEVAGSVALRLSIATVIVVLVTLYAASQGDRLAAEFPRGNAQPAVRGRTLSVEAIDSVDAMGQVTIRPTGDVRDIEGYPPLDPPLRESLEDGVWRLPVDLPLSALESRLERQLRQHHDLETVTVSIDARGRAAIAGAPPIKGVGKQVPDGWRAVSIPAVLPSGLSSGDRVRLEMETGSVTGQVLSTTASTGSAATMSRLTVAVPTTDAGAVLDADRARVVVVSAGATHAFEAVSKLERTGKTVRRLVLDTETLGALESTAELCPFAVRSNAEGWVFEPPVSTLESGDDVMVVGDRIRLAALAGSGLSTGRPETVEVAR
ncbi:potassium transporter TrkA [Natronosalvus amylolyticus]|uniref:potassium transporter TrkA n=1 Tax=Natronosalvus amylolyticus TaxID=2961994 RepID=UPI0020C9B721|nr:potassium transporter TrkA [Natronosalvus amylolyticus]